MDCPFCNAPNAYVGLITVECSNKECKAFSQRQLNECWENLSKDIDLMFEAYINPED